MLNDSYKISVGFNLTETIHMRLGVYSYPDFSPRPFAAEKAVKMLLH